MIAKSKETVHIVGGLFIVIPHTTMTLYTILTNVLTLTVFPFNYIGLLNFSKRKGERSSVFTLDTICTMLYKEQYEPVTLDSIISKGLAGYPQLRKRDWLRGFRQGLLF